MKEFTTRILPQLRVELPDGTGTSIRRWGRCRYYADRQAWKFYMEPTSYTDRQIAEFCEEWDATTQSSSPADWSEEDSHNSRRLLIESDISQRSYFINMMFNNLVGEADQKDMEVLLTSNTWWWDIERDSGGKWFEMGWSLDLRAAFIITSPRMETKQELKVCWRFGADSADQAKTMLEYF